MAAAEAAHLAARRAEAAVPDLASKAAMVAAESRARKALRAGGLARGRAPLPIAAGIAAGWAATVSLVPVAAVVALLQAAEPGPVSVGDSLRVAVAGWLLAHGVPVTTAAGPLGLAPLALTALAAWRLIRAGVHVSRAMGARGSRSLRSAGLAALGVGLGYGGLGVVTGSLVDSPGWAVTPVRAGLTLAAFGFVGAGYGSLRAVGLTTAWANRVPRLVRDGGRCGLVAALTLAATGAATAGIAIAAAGEAAAETLAAYRTGVVGLSGLVLLCLAYAPNLAVWAVAYLVGPGFAVGAGTVVRGSDLVVGSLPPLPVFAGLPEGPLPTAGAILLLAPVVAGGVGGWLLARGVGTGGDGLGSTQEPSWAGLAGGAVVSGVVGGSLLGLAAVASRGSLGGGSVHRRSAALPLRVHGHAGGRPGRRCGGRGGAPSVPGNSGHHGRHGQAGVWPLC